MARRRAWARKGAGAQITAYEAFRAAHRL